MKKPKVCILRVGGTNCDFETKIAFEEAGAEAEIIHTNKAVKQGLEQYHIITIPGGFSYGDYVRAGAIWAKRLAAKLGGTMAKLVEEERLVLGICNGFQVLVEMGLLPGFEGMSKIPQASLAVNVSAKYECRWVYLKHVGSGKCAFTKLIPKGAVLRMPVAHAEGRFILPKEKEKEYLAKMYINGQIIFKYCLEDGKSAEGKYPYNPNGSIEDIAAICNPKGNLMSLMPHPERAIFYWQLPDWTRLDEFPTYCDGMLIFKSAVEYAREHLV